jgi:hypothetical protein
MSHSFCTLLNAQKQALHSCCETAYLGSLVYECDVINCHSPSDVLKLYEKGVFLVMLILRKGPSYDMQIGLTQLLCGTFKVRSSLLGSFMCKCVECNEYSWR